MTYQRGMGIASWFIFFREEYLFHRNYFCPKICYPLIIFQGWISWPGVLNFIPIIEYIFNLVSCFFQAMFSLHTSALFIVFKKSLVTSPGLLFPFGQSFENFIRRISSDLLKFVLLKRYSILNPNSLL